jgi:hypothetical protein
VSATRARGPVRLIAPVVCPICFDAKGLAADQLLTNAELKGTVQLWEWIGDGATTFSY